jgi:hypothetical protein
MTHETIGYPNIKHICSCNFSSLKTNENMITVDSIHCNQLKPESQRKIGLFLVWPTKLKAVLYHTLNQQIMYAPIVIVKKQNQFLFVKLHHLQQIKRAMFHLLQSSLSCFHPSFCLSGSLRRLFCITGSQIYQLL